MRLIWNIAIAVTAPVTAECFAQAETVMAATDCFAQAEMTVMAAETSQNEKIALPAEVYVEGGKSHVQGLALDEQAGRMYFSFTTSFVKTDLEGRVLGSIDRIQGHLGAMTFDPRERKVYATLECKDDAIGAGLSAFAKGRSMFYVAIIDVDRIDRIGMDSEDNDAFRIVCIKDATRDYHYEGHRYGCSGIDGIALAPKLGRKACSGKYLYIAYGIYGDKDRRDNDYQVLLRYDTRALEKFAGKVKYGEFYEEGPEKAMDKYFIFTGNTNWGVQNLAYDKASGLMYMAVYKGSKPEFGNFDLFVFDISQKPSRLTLDGVSYDRTGHKTIGSREAPVTGFRFKYGSTGLCPAGDGLFYISENGKNPDSGRQFCRARLYRWTGAAEGCFVRVE